MANSIWTTEQFTCLGCGIDYTAVKEERPDNCSGSFKCAVCHAEVHAWSGNLSYFGWEAIKTKSPIFGKKKQAFAEERNEVQVTLADLPDGQLLSF